jgi:hypothetical protein
MGEREELAATWPDDAQILEMLVESGYDAIETHPACYRGFGWKTFTEKMRARVMRGRAQTRQVPGLLAEIRAHLIDSGLWTTHPLVEKIDAALRAPEAADAYRSAVDDEMVLCNIGVTTGDARKDIRAVIEWNIQVALDPRVSKEAADTGAVAWLGQFSDLGCEVTTDKERADFWRDHCAMDITPLYASPRDAGMRAALEPFASYEMRMVSIGWAATLEEIQRYNWIAGFDGPVQPEFRHFKAAKDVIPPDAGTTDVTSTERDTATGGGVKS